MRPVGNTLSLSRLSRVMPTLPSAKAEEYLAHLEAACQRWEITTRLRQAAFLAQIAHESGELRYWEEIADGTAYEGRADLGNIRPGDGPRYKGRGPIQLTGRHNYLKAGQALGLDLEAEPVLVARPDVGCQVAGWFWASHGLNELADVGEFAQITRRINGGLRAWRERVVYYGRAL